MKTGTAEFSARANCDFRLSAKWELLKQWKAFRQLRNDFLRPNFPNLGDGEFQGTDTGLEGAGLVAKGSVIHIDTFDGGRDGD